MKFIAKCTTDDGRLTNGEIYYGQLIWLPDAELSWDSKDLSTMKRTHLRICVFDNKGDWMTFNPIAFIPAGLLFNLKKVHVQPYDGE